MDSTGAPSIGVVSPDSGSGKTQTFTSTYADPAGAQNVIAAFLLIEKTATGINSCFLEYNSRDKTVNLMTDAGKWQTAVAAGSSSALANTQCSIDASGVRGAVDGNTLTVNLPITFSSAYAGPKRIFLSASGATKATPWIDKGSWIIP